MNDPGLVAAGWTLLAILWQTTTVAVLLALWRSQFPRAAARAQHAAAATAFVAAVGSALATPALLRSLPPAGTSPVSLVPAAVLHAAPAGASDVAAATIAGVSGQIPSFAWDTIAPVVTLAWMLGVIVLAVRLACGLVTVAGVRRRAVRLTSGDLHDLAKRVSAEVGVTRSVAVLASAEIDAPAIVGWRSPALLVPAEAMSLLSPEMVAALFAHELAHVRRRDYLVNLLQSFAEAVLFFSPAVAWMGRCVRETREDRCDDEAVGRGADPHAYVRALAALASGGALAGSQTAMGATGPRLVTRIRRLLSIEQAPRLVVARRVLCAVALVALTISGAPVMLASAARLSQLDRITTPLGVPPYPPVPYAFSTGQFDGEVEMDELVSTLAEPVRRVTVRNTSARRLVGIRFAAAVEQMSSRRRPIVLPGPARLFVSGWHRVSIAPGDGVRIAPGVMSGEALQEIVAAAAGAHVQFHVAIAAVQYDDGTERHLALNPLAVRARDALDLGEGPSFSRALAGAVRLVESWPGRIASVFQPRPSVMATVPRSMIGGDSRSGVCRDELNRAYSAGAIVGVRSEPGQRARCEGGRWLDTAER